MTSRKSFWDKLIKSNKSNIWMWVISFLAMIGVYPVKLLVFFNSIAAPSSISKASEVKFYIETMRENACNVIGYNGLLVFMILGVLIPAKLYMYLNDKSKMDLLRSIPVKHRNIYLIDYISGILMVILPYLFSIIIAIIIAGSWGFMTPLALKEGLLGFAANITNFLIAYNITIICISLSGNIVVALAGSAGLQLGVGIAEGILYSLQFDFYKTANSLVGRSLYALSPSIAYYNKLDNLKSASTIENQLSIIGGYLIFWLLLAIATSFLSFRAYMSRPVEAMNKPVYSRKIQLTAKFILGVSGAIISSYWIYQSAGYSNKVFAISLGACALIIGMAMEAIYANDFKAVIKSFVTSIGILVICLCIFCIYNFDIFGFDKYVPDETNITSFAIDVNPEYYSNVLDITYSKENKTVSNVSWYSQFDYYKDHMYITDIDAINRLASKCKEEKLYKLNSNSIYAYSLYYRTKFGPNRTRTVYVDMNDSESVDLINRIVKSDEWKNGFFQILGDREKLSNIGDMDIRYTDDIKTYFIDCTFDELVNAFKEDMKIFDYYLGRNQLPSGNISIKVNNSDGYNFIIPVYDEFHNTLSIIQSKATGYSPERITADDIDSVRVTNYHSDYWDQEDADYNVDPSVTISITDPKEIEELLEISRPDGICRFFYNNDSSIYSYDIQVFFSSNSRIFPLGNMINYRLTENAPSWLVEKTKMN